MTGKDFNLLNVGDIVEHVSSYVRYVVTGNYGGRITAVKTVDLTNSSEWELILKCDHTLVTGE